MLHHLHWCIPNELHHDLGKNMKVDSFMCKRARLLICIQNFPKAHDLKNVQKSTSISPYNKVIHKGPPQTGCENSQFCQNRGSNDKSKERFFQHREKMGTEIGFFIFKIDPKRNLVPNFHCPQSKAKDLSGLLSCLDFITSSSGMYFCHYQLR
jgi:hypothetical protein